MSTTAVGITLDRGPFSSVIKPRLAASHTSDGGLAEAKASGGLPLGVRRSSDLFNHLGCNANMMFADVLFPGEFFEVFRIHTPRILAAMMKRGRL